MKNLHFEIIKELYNSSTPLTSNYLALKFGVSSKTIYRNMDSIKEICTRNGANILRKPSLGVYIEVLDKKMFKNFMNQGIEKSTYDTQENRLNYLLKVFLLSEDYHKSQDIADELYISTSCLNNDLKSLKKDFEKYNLQLSSKSNHGLTLTGDEFDKRLCMSDLLFKNNDFSFINEKILNLKDSLIEIVTDILVKRNISISTNSLDNFVLHILLLIYRIENNFIISYPKDYVANLENKAEYHITKEITDLISEMFNITLPDPEIYYLSCHLTSKKYFDLQGKEDSSLKIDTESINIVNLILKNIFNFTRLDFYDDYELKNNLLLHMIPFLHRLKNNIYSHNPLKDDIKIKYPYAYEVASIGLSPISTKLQVKISDDEIAFFALHFVLALDRLKRKEQLNLIIVCCTGRAMSQLLLYQIQNKFGYKISSIKVVEYHLLKKEDLLSFDYIISTVPIKDSFPIPVIQIHPLLDDKTINLLEAKFEERKSSTSSSFLKLLKKDLFFNDIQAKNKNDALLQLIERTKRIIPLTDNFYEYVLERESFCSTELNNFISIPHPINNTCKESFVSIGILKKPILWDTKQIQIIFLISFNVNEKNKFQSFYKALHSLLNSPKYINKFLNNQDYEDLINFLSK